MMRKFFIYCESDGFKSAVFFLRKTLCRFIFRKSKTYFYAVQKVSMEYKPIEGYEIRELPLEEVESLHFPRLKVCNYKKWFAEGGKVYVGFYNGVPVSYTWTHFGKYHFSGLGDFLMGNSECWIGPTFVHRRYRGLGLNRAQLLYQIANEHLSICYGSANESNISSIKSIERIGFKKIGSVSVLEILGKKKVYIDGLDVNRIRQI